MSHESSGNYEAFRDSVSECIIDRSRIEAVKTSKKRVSKKHNLSIDPLHDGDTVSSRASGDPLGDPAELADFVEVAMPPT